MRLALAALALSFAAPALASAQPWDVQVPSVLDASPNERLRELVDAQRMRVRQIESAVGDHAVAKVSRFEARNAAALVPTTSNATSPTTILKSSR